MTDLSAGAVSVNGRITAPEDARVPATDHGFLYGDSVYEVVRTWLGRPVGLAAHLVRLRASAAAIYMEIPWSDADLRAAMAQTVRATGLSEVYVRVVATRGPGPMSLLPDGCDQPGLVVYVLPFPTAKIAAQAGGIPVVIPPRLRNDERALSPSAKTGNYLNNLLALVEARRKGGDDAVLENVAGDVTEATTANVFWVRGGRVFTPSLDCGILEGITRALLLPALRTGGIDVEEGRYPVTDLTGADEVFLTGTVRGVAPVIRIDGRTVGDGAPGAMTRRIAAINDRAMQDNAEDWEPR